MILKIPVAELLLDERNPRFREHVASQNEAIAAVLALAPNKLVNLAKDISEHGETNPTELMVVVEEDEQYVVVEGNRRLAALKLLRHPDLAGTPALSQNFATIARTNGGPDAVMCFVADSRDSARHWLELRHTGENDGVGIVTWEAWQVNNFRRRPGSQSDRADRFCTAVEVEFPDEAELQRNISKVRENRLTTLGRLVSDPDVRQAFGFDFVDSAVVFHYPSSELLPGLTRIFSELAGDLTVTEIKTKLLRENFVRQSASTLPARAARLNEPRSPGSEPSAAVSTREPIEAVGPDRGQTARRRSMPAQESVIFKGLRLSNVDLRTSKMLTQAQAIDIDSSPAVAAVLVRVIIELVTTEAVVKYRWAQENESLKRKIAAALKKLDPNIQDLTRCDRILEPAWLRSQSDAASMVQSMNAFVHSVISNPTAAEVRELSLTFRPLLERLDSYLRAHP